MPSFLDNQGLKVTAASPESALGISRFGDALLAFSNKADCILATADDDPDCPLAQAYAAMFHGSADTRAGLTVGQAYMERAQRTMASASERERLIVTAADLWLQGQRAAAAATFEQVLDEHPNDIVSAKWAQSLHFDCGNSAGILRAPLKVAAACDGNAHLHGMLAFGYEECHLLAPAEAAVNRAVELDRTEAWAHHAMAHINESRNTMSAGLDFMLGLSDTWRGLTSFMYTHNWWHVCLFLIDTNRGEEALALFDKSVWGINRGCVQDQINAISLLYRIERTGIDVGGRWADVARAVEQNSFDQVSVFLDLQFLYVLGRANPQLAEAMNERMLARQHTATKDERVAWGEVAVLAAPGVLALTKGDFRTAADLLGRARPSLQAIGGSHAQRELMMLFYIDALRGAGQWEKVQQILARRHAARPRVSWISAQLKDAYANLGLSGAVGTTS